MIKGSPFSAGESGGVGAVADDEESWKIMSAASGSKGLEALHGLESSKLSKLQLKLVTLVYFAVPNGLT
jgi:hypothetical protein